MAKAINKSDKEQQELKEKANFNIRSSLIRKLKIIAATEDVFQNDIIDKLLADYISSWEKKNGEIKIK